MKRNLFLTLLLSHSEITSEAITTHTQHVVVERNTKIDNQNAVIKSPHSMTATLRSIQEESLRNPILSRKTDKVFLIAYAIANAIAATLLFANTRTAAKKLYLLPLITTVMTIWYSYFVIRKPTTLIWIAIISIIISILNTYHMKDMTRPAFTAQDLQTFMQFSFLSDKVINYINLSLTTLNCFISLVTPAVVSYHPTPRNKNTKKASLELHENINSLHHNTNNNFPTMTF